MADCAETVSALAWARPGYAARPPGRWSLACSSDQKKRLRAQKAWMMLGSLSRLKFTSGTAPGVVTW